MQRLGRMLRKNSDGPSGGVGREAAAPDSRAADAPTPARRPDQPPPTSVAWQPQVPDDRSWADVGGVHRPNSEPVQLLDSKADPGGASVRVDPAMVNPATAERMRPLIRP